MHCIMHGVHVLLRFQNFDAAVYSRVQLPPIHTVCNAAAAGLRRRQPHLSNYEAPAILEHASQ